MNIRSLGLTVAAGIVAFLLVGVAVTELLASRIEFSLLVGLPAGLLAGALTIALVALGLGDSASPQRRKIAESAGAFAVAFLIVLVAGAVLPVGLTIAIVAGVAVGLLVAAISYRRGIPGLDTPTGTPPET